MSQVAIVTDSTTYFPKEYIEKYNLSIAPQILIWDNKTYQDGIDIQPEEFYQKLKTATVMPTTSQATIPAFIKIYDDLPSKGYDNILTITLSSDLSGTMDSAIQARQNFPGASIEIVDSRTTAMAMGFQVLSDLLKWVGTAVIGGLSVAVTTLYFALVKSHKESTDLHVKSVVSADKLGDAIEKLNVQLQNRPCILKDPK